MCKLFASQYRNICQYLVVNKAKGDDDDVDPVCEYHVTWAWACWILAFSELHNCRYLVVNNSNDDDDVAPVCEYHGTQAWAPATVSFSL